MVGRRLPVVDGKATMPTEPGEYCGPVEFFGTGIMCWFFLKPNARDEDAPRAARSVQHVRSPPHTYRECDDGSLEIRASIGDTARGGTESDGWHGFLDEGHVWREC